MSSNKFNFDLVYQLNILHLMLTDELFLLKCNKHVIDSFFENEYLGWVFNKICFYYKRYEKSPEISYLINELNNFDEEKDKVIYRQYIVRVVKSKPTSSIYVKDSLEEFVKRNLFVGYYEKLAEIYMSSPDKAYKYATKKSEEISNLTFKDDGIYSFKHADEIIKEANLLNSIAETGITEIDKALGGGIRSGEVCTILGDTGIGKSIILVNFGVLSMLNGYRVFHINLEGRKSIPMTRYLSRLTEIPCNSVKTLSFKNTDEKNRFEKVKKEYEDRLFIYHNGSFMYTIEELKVKCKEVYKTFSFDLVVVDYGDILKTRDKMEMRLQQTNVFRGLNCIADTFKCPVITASQAVRPERERNKNFKRYLSLSDMSESYEKVRISPVIVAVSRTEIEEKENKLRISLIKNRDGIRNVKVGCHSNYPVMVPYSKNLGFYNPDDDSMDEKF